MNHAKLKLAFAGTPELARIVLKSLIDTNQHNIGIAFTKPDRPAGRGHKIKQSEVKTLYKGHEIASHSYSHPGFAGLDTAELKLQLARDKHILSPLKGSPLQSFAYPLGSYDKAAMKLVKQAGFTNARTVNDTLNFELPTNYMAWNPTVHHSKAMPLIEQYIALKSNKLTVMMIWGHSWEFDKNTKNNNWDYAEQLVQTISNKDDIWYVSAGEFIAFLEGK